MTSEKVSLACKVDPEVRKQFRLLAAKRDTSMSKLLREQVFEVLDEADSIDSDHVTPEQHAD